MNRLIISELQLDQAKKHLLKEGEAFAFFLCGLAEFEDSTNFLVRHTILLLDTDFELVEGVGLQMKLESLLQVTNRARKEQSALVEAHSHPWSKKDLCFSQTDLKGLKEFVPYILDDIPGMPYAATVWGTESIDGIRWKSSPKQAANLAEMRIVGKNLARMITTSSLKRIRNKCKITSDGKAARQILAIGQQGQEQIRQTSVAIVGLGGLGSQVAQLLAYLGVENFVLIDFDKVETVNLNRLVSAGPRDLGRSKVKVAEKMIKRITHKDYGNVQKFECDMREKRVLAALKGVDVIFGCVDRDGPRLILNELALAYMIPYIDCAFGINVEKGAIKEAGGRVILVEPDGPCLVCCKEIDIRAASDDLASVEELTVRKRQGYVSGADVPSPSVVSLDATVASIAATEFLALVTGFRPAQTYTFYDMIEQRIVPRIVKSDPKCVACSVKGLGDKANIERYANKEAPKDVPVVK